MSGANIGTAYMTVSPRFENLGKSVNDALGSVDTTSSGVKMGQGVSDGFETGTKGLAASGALIGAFGAITTQAMNMISSSVSGAASRMDTLNNYPKIMQTLGYSADDAESSISKMATHLTGLPTALNDMASTVQGIAAVTGNLTEATDAGLALNDMLLASGSNTTLVNSAMEQFRQMLAKGKPDMQDWKSLTSAMPGQMKQLAQALLGPTANANDLYTAIGGGGATATISMDQLMAKMIEMDSASEDGFTSFAEQAESATGGVQNSFANMEVAITRGVTDVMQSIGTDTISGVLSGIGSGFETALKTIGSGIEAAKPVVEGIVGVMKEIAPAALPAIAALAGLWGAGKAVGGIASIVVNVAGSFSRLSSSTSGVGEALLNLAGKAEQMGGAGTRLSGVLLSLASTLSGPVVLGIGLAVAAAAVIGTQMYTNWKKTKDLNDSTDALNRSMDTLAPTVSIVKSAYGTLASSLTPTVKGFSEVATEIDAAVQANKRLADSVSSRNSSTMSDIALLATYQQTIDDYAGKTGLSADAQSQLETAVDGVNGILGTQYTVVDAVNGVLADEEGATDGVKDSIDALCDSKEKELRLEAAEEDYKDAYKTYLENKTAYVDAKSAYDAANTQLQTDIANGVNGNQIAQEGDQVAKLKSNLDEAAAAMDAAKTSADGWKNTMKDAGNDVDTMTTKISTMASSSQGVTYELDQMGMSSDDLASKLSAAGVSADEMSGVSTADFAQMLAACGGNITTLAAMIQGYNATPIVDKDGNITIDAVSLWDAQGNVYTWNGTQVVDKDGNAVVDDVKLTDAQGDLVTWNGSSLNSYSSTANITGNLHDALSWQQFWNQDGLSSYSAEGRIALTATRYAAGGFINMHAAGGIVERMHAAGYVATRPTVIDIAGEAGDEAIIPLSNARYSAPFAQQLAEQSGLSSVAEEMGRMRANDAALISVLTDLRDNGVAANIDGKRASKVLAPHISRELAAEGTKR